MQIHLGSYIWSWGWEAVRWRPPLFLVMFSKSELPSENWAFALLLRPLPPCPDLCRGAAVWWWLPLEPWLKPWHRWQEREVNPGKWRTSNKKEGGAARGSLPLLLLHYPLSLICPTSYDVIFPPVSFQTLTKQRTWMKTSYPSTGMSWPIR